MEENQNERQRATQIVFLRRPAAALLFAPDGAAARSQAIVLNVRPESEAAALAVGADAFVGKTDPPEEVLEALRTLAQGCRAKAFV